MQQAYGLGQIHGPAASAGHQSRAALAAEQGQGRMRMQAGGFAAGLGIDRERRARLPQGAQHRVHRTAAQQYRARDQQHFAGNPAFDQRADACGLAFAEGDQPWRLKVPRAHLFLARQLSAVPSRQRGFAQHLAVKRKTHLCGHGLGVQAQTRHVKGVKSENIAMGFIAGRGAGAAIAGAPKSVRDSTAPAGSRPRGAAFSGKERAEAGMSNTTQCHQPLPVGASGS